MSFKVPAQKINDYARAQFATEVAFNCLISQANKIGLNLYPALGLSHIDLELAQEFTRACHNVLLSLVDEKTLFKGYDRKNHFKGEPKPKSKEK